MGAHAPAWQGLLVLIPQLRWSSGERVVRWGAGGDEVRLGPRGSNFPGSRNNELPAGCGHFIAFQERGLGRCRCQEGQSSEAPSLTRAVWEAIWDAFRKCFLLELRAELGRLTSGHTALYWPLLSPHPKTPGLPGVWGSVSVRGILLTVLLKP